jgi:putative transposase
MTRPPRLPAIAYQGFREYLLTFCAYDRRRYFIDGDVVALARTQFLRASSTGQFEIVAYCFMPDHVHLLVTGTAEGADLRVFAARAKQLSGHRFARMRHSRLWQEGFYDHVVRSEESRPAIVRYIIENPVRAGLVETAAEYPHWGSERYTRDEVAEIAALAIVGDLPRCRG